MPEGVNEETGKRTPVHLRAWGDGAERPSQVAVKNRESSQLTAEKRAI